MKRSTWSTRPAVTPQAAKPLWPALTAGVPTSEAPATDHLGVRRWARYQWGGRPGARWGSLARMGLPETVRLPATAQALEPAPAPAKARARKAAGTSLRW